MEKLKGFVIGIIASLAVYAARLFSELSAFEKNTIDYANKYNQIKIIGLIIMVFVVSLALLYLIPFLKNKINHYKRQKNRPINILTEAHKNNTIKVFQNLSRIEKDILLFYYINLGKKSHEFSDDFIYIESVKTLYNLGVLYKPSELLYTEDEQSNNNTYTLNDDAKDYIKKHPKILE